ncbi:hypothetical protein B0H19DRAFT_1367909 [Mycena capillaripes]|nr:hypothetical protein B0H19DRAFT_1367909 [Mycena capillaripes]
MLLTLFAFFPPLLYLSVAQVIYRGTWAPAYPPSQCGDFTLQPGSSANWEFNGTYIQVFGVFPTNPATLTATLDGVAVPLTPNATGCNVLLFNSTLLPFTLHTLNLTFSGDASSNASYFGITGSTFAAAPNSVPIIANTTSTASSPASNASSPASATVSGTGAKVGGGIGGAVLALLAATAATYHYLKAPTPSASHHTFVFIPPVPIVSRQGQPEKHQASNPCITIVLKPRNLVVQKEKPKGVIQSMSTSYNQVAWKVIELEEGKETMFRLPKNLGFGDVSQEDVGGIFRILAFSFAPLRTLVRRMHQQSLSWTIPSKFWDRDLSERVVLAQNGADVPAHFALGTFHLPSDGLDEEYLSPFVVILVPDGHFCITSQCEDLNINAYVTKNMKKHQLVHLSDTLSSSGPGSRPPLPPRENGAFEEPIADDGPDDGAPEIISTPLLGENGTHISTLKQTTVLKLVKDSEWRLEIVEQETKFKLPCF